MFARLANVRAAPRAKGRRTISWSTEMRPAARTTVSNSATLFRGPTVRQEFQPSRMSMRDAIGPASALQSEMKSVDFSDEESDGFEVLNGPDAGAPAPAPSPPPKTPAPPPAAPAAAKTAGVDSFTVKWAENAQTTATNTRLRLDFSATFKDDATHDPALAEFRQNAGSTWSITAGTHSGQKKTTALRDDNYSRADDTAGNAKTSKNFVSNDNPGLPIIAADDVLDYTFTAEQMIIDTSTGKEVQKKGPHSGTITGKHPRTFGGVPVTL